MDKFADIAKAVKEAKDKGIITSIADEKVFRDQQRAASGLSEEIYKYIGSLNKASEEQLTFSEVVKIGTMTLKENALAFIKSPFGIASIAVAGIYALVKAIDYYDGALERSREKLSGLKEEYTSVSSELSSLENELDSTAERLEELENLNKSGAITIAEKEELDLLRQQNSELDRKINLLKQEQALKQREINSTFIETFDQDIGNSNVIADGTEDGSYKTVSDGEILQGKIELYRKNLQRIKRIEEETEASVNNAMEAGDYALATRLQDEAKAQVNQLENANKNIQASLTERKNYLVEYLEGVTYIPDTNDELQKEVNNRIVQANDIIDSIAIAFGETLGDGVTAKSDAITRLTNTVFADSTEALKELGKQGKLTADELRSEAYDEFIQKLLDIGVIAGKSDKDLSFVVNWFNKLGETVSSTGQIIGSSGLSIDTINEKIDSVQEAVSSLSGALTKLHDGSLTIAEVIDLIQQFPELAEYVDLTADGFGNLNEGLTKLMKQAPEDLIEQLEGLKDTTELTEEQTEAIDQMIYALRNMEDASLRDLTGEFGVLAEAINGAKQAKSELDKALSEEDYDTGYEARVEAFKGMKEVFASGEFGSKAFSAYKDYFGLTGESTESIKAWMDANAKYFAEGKAGVDQFMKAIDSMDDAGGKLEGIASFDTTTGEFRYDINRLSDFADALGWTEEMLQDFIDKYRMYCEEWTSRTPAMTNAEFIDQNLILESTSGAIASLSELQSYTHLSAEGVADLIEKINAYRKINGLPTVQVIGLDEVTVTQDYVDALAKTKQNADEVRTALVELSNVEGVDFESHITFDGQTIEEILASGGIKGNETYDIPVELVGADGTPFITHIEVIDSEVAEILGDGWEAYVQDNGQLVIDKMTELKSLLEQLSRGKYSITIGAKTTTSDNALQWIIGGIQTESTSAPTSYKNPVVPGISTGAFTSNATGTNNAKRGPALLGDEYSPDGSPKPELVVTDNGAYIAGANGPEIGYLNDGDIVYTADQTKRILRGSRSNRLSKIPAYGPGKNNQLSMLSQYEKDPSNIKVLSTGLSGGRPEIDPPNDGPKVIEEVKKTFEDLYAEHQHMLAMDQENSEEYLKWLEGAYKEAYKNNEIELEDFRKYEEECYELQKELFSDHIGDIKFQIEQLEREGDKNLEIIDLYIAMFADLAGEIEAARERGLDDNSDYIQELISQQNECADRITEIQEEATDDAKSAVEDLIDYRIDMLKQELEDEKDALDKRLDDLKDFYDKQKEMLQDAYDEEEYLDEQREKRKAKKDIEAELARLQFDDSAWAQKRKLELQDELADANKELADFEKDHALETTLDFLDKTYEKQESKIQSEIDAIDAKLNDPEALYNKALADIQANTLALYEEMVAYNKKHGDGNAESTEEMWNEAKDSLDAYKSTYGEAYKGITLVPIPTGSGYASGTSSASAGLHQLFEKGDEYFFTSPSTGKRYKVFSGGEKVLNAEATNFLYNFANSGGEMITRMFSDLVNALTPSNISSPKRPIQLTTGDIIIQGNADTQTVSQIRRAQRDGMDYLLKELQRLNR